MLSNKKTPNGFTIVELTLALLVSAVVLAAGYDLFRALRDTADKQDQSTARFWMMVDALERIKEDLLHSVPTSSGQGAVLAGGNAVFDSERFKLLEFYSLCVTGYPGKVCGVRQIHKIEYELVKEEDLLRLFRTTIPVIGKSESFNTRNRKLILDEIEHVKIFFHDGRRLLPSFSSEQHLPVYVKLELTANGQTRPLVVKLPCGIPETEQGL